MHKESAGIVLGKDLAEIRHILHQKLKGHKVSIYFFGSRAKGTAYKTSDIDVAILPHEPLPPGLIAEIREELEESHVPFSIDLVDLTNADPAFRDRVLKEGISWSDLESE